LLLAEWGTVRRCATAWQARFCACALLAALSLDLAAVAHAQDCDSSAVVGAEDPCTGDQSASTDPETQRVRAERRGSVAAMGTFIALMSAFAVPATFVPVGVASLLRRLHVLQQNDVRRLRHNAYRTRVRVLPLVGMTALSVTSLSSRFWWAGVMTASCGVSADVLLAHYWRHGGRAKRGIGIATATVAAAAGLALNIETLGNSEPGAARAFMPTLSVGIAQVEVGVVGSF